MAGRGRRKKNEASLEEEEVDSLPPQKGSPLIITRSPRTYDEDDLAAAITKSVVKSQTHAIEETATQAEVQRRTNEQAAMLAEVQAATQAEAQRHKNEQVAARAEAQTKFSGLIQTILTQQEQMVQNNTEAMAMPREAQQDKREQRAAAVQRDMILTFRQMISQALGRW